MRPTGNRLNVDDNTQTLRAFTQRVAAAGFDRDLYLILLLASGDVADTPVSKLGFDIL